MRHFILICFFIILTVPTVVHAQLPDSERDGLFDLRARLSGWGSKWNITEQPDPCNWSGIQCIQLLQNSPIKHVAVLALPRAGLTGTIANFNFSAFPSLHALHVANNAISGGFPLLSNLSSLGTIDFSYNNFNESITAASIPKFLATMVLSENPRLTGSFFPPLDGVNSGSLQTVQINGCGFTGTIPSMERFTNLRSFEAQQNAFTGDVPRFGPRLQILYLGYNQFTHVNGSDIPASVNYLTLGGNNFAQTFPNLSHIIDPAVIDLSDSEFIGSIPLSFLPLPGLIANRTGYQLSLTNNMLSGDLPNITYAWLTTRVSAPKFTWTIDCEDFNLNAHDSTVLTWPSNCPLPDPSITAASSSSSSSSATFSSSSSTGEGGTSTSSSSAGGGTSNPNTNGTNPNVATRVSSFDISFIIITVAAAQLLV